MDYQNRVGSKKGSGGLAGSAETNQYRQERVKSLLLSNTNIESDPYVFRNNLNILECKLCLTTHMNETSYLTHRNGRRHVTNLLRRSEREERKKQKAAAQAGHNTEQTAQEQTKRHWEPIGRPLYTVVKVQHPTHGNKGLRIDFELPELKQGVVPMYRLMSCFEQRKELPPDPQWQYLVVSCEPYQNVCFKIPGNTIALSGELALWDFFDEDAHEYHIQLFYLDL